MKTWNDHQIYGQSLLNMTPGCIPYNMNNILSPMVLREDNKVELLRKEFEVVDEENKVVRLKDVYVSGELVKDLIPPEANEADDHNNLDSIGVVKVTNDSERSDINLDNHDGIWEIRTSWRRKFG